MYRRNRALAILIASMSTVLSCTGGPASDDAVEFSQSSFDGEWTWYENDEAVFDLTIINGEIASLQSLQRNASGLKFVNTKTVIDGNDGLSYLIFFQANEERLTQFRFDEDSRGCGSLEMCAGTRSENIYSEVDEIRVRTSSANGELRRRSAD